MTFGAPLSATVVAARALTPSPPLEETSKRLLAASTVALQCDAATPPACPAAQSNGLLDLYREEMLASLKKKSLAAYRAALGASL